jgi:hypothetical protein
MRRFAGIELISDRIPDETTILAFRHLLEKHKLGEQIFETVKAHLSHLDCCAQLDQEQGRETRSGDAPDQEGQPVVSPLRGRLRLRDKGPRRHGQGLRPDPFARRHRRQRA